MQMERHRHGGDIYTYKDCIDFSANSNPLGTPPSVVRAAAESLAYMENYPDPDCRELRGALARYESVSPEQVICTGGAAELIYGVCLAVHPRKALLVSPGFAEYEAALQALGDCQISFFSLRPEDGFVLPESFPERLTPDTDCVFLCSPNNPDGRIIPHKLLLAIAGRCREYRIRLVLDECFLDFAKEGRKLSLVPLLPENPCILIMKAFTKRYGMAGLRLGYGLCSDTDLLERIGEVLPPWRVSSVAQAAGIAALVEEDHVRRGREMVTSEREYLDRELRSLGLRTWPSEANYILFRGPEDLFESLRSRGILIRDCSNYRGLSPGYWRVAVRCPSDNRRLIRELRKALGGMVQDGKSDHDTGNHVQCG